MYLILFSYKSTVVWVSTSLAELTASLFVFHDGAVPGLFLIEILMWRGTERRPGRSIHNPLSERQTKTENVPRPDLPEVQ